MLHLGKNLTNEQKGSEGKHTGESAPNGTWLTGNPMLSPETCGHGVGIAQSSVRDTVFCFATFLGACGSVSSICPGERCKEFWRAKVVVARIC